MSLSLLLLLLLLVGGTQASHFYGTVMTYYPKDTNADGSLRVVARYKLSFTSCTDVDTWSCTGNCGNETSVVLNVVQELSGEWCQREGIMTRQLNSNAPFQLDLDGGNWIFNSQSITSWRAVTEVELRNRSDTGRANRSPQTTVLPALRVPSNCPRDFNLLAFDADGDEVKCRIGNSSSECNSCTLPSSLRLSSLCTLSFNGNSTQGTYAVQLVMEDFPRQAITLTATNGAQESLTTNNAISKLPVQFAVRVDAAVTDCTEGLYLPKFLPPTPANGARLYTPVNQPLEIRINAQANISTISELLFSGPHNTNRTTDAGQFVLTWTPSADEEGESHPFCFVVQANVSTVKYHSELRCLIVSVGNDSTTTTIQPITMPPTTTTMTPTTTTATPNTTTATPNTTTVTPNITTATPNTTTATPNMTIAILNITTATPNITTATPNITTATPNTTTATPNTTTVTPNITTATPNTTTSTPNTTTVTPNITTATPNTTTATPNMTIAILNITTATPNITTATPNTTTATPNMTIAILNTTTVTPNITTATPNTTTATPNMTIAILNITTATPNITTATPNTTTATPNMTIAILNTTTVTPNITTATPNTTTVTPNMTIAILNITTATPNITTATPNTTTATPNMTIAILNTTTATPTTTTATPNTTTATPTTTTATPTTTTATPTTTTATPTTTTATPNTTTATPNTTTATPNTTTATPTTTPTTTTPTPTTTTMQTTTLSTATTEVTTPDPNQFVIGLRVRISSLFPLSEEDIRTTFIQQLKDEIMTLGLSSAITLRLVSSMQLGSNTTATPAGIR